MSPHVAFPPSHRRGRRACPMGPGARGVDQGRGGCGGLKSRPQWNPFQDVRPSAVVSLVIDRLWWKSPCLGPFLAAQRRRSLGWEISEFHLGGSEGGIPGRRLAFRSMDTPETLAARPRGGPGAAVGVRPKPLCSRPRSNPFGEAPRSAGWGCWSSTDWGGRERGAHPSLPPKHTHKPIPTSTRNTPPPCISPPPVHRDFFPRNSFI